MARGVFIINMGWHSDNDRHMEHVSELLAIRKRQLEMSRQRELFSVRISPARPEKGSGEWRSFNPVRDDAVDMYPVRIPKKPIVVAEPHHVLRIIYPPARMAHGV